MIYQIYSGIPRLPVVDLMIDFHWWRLILTNHDRKSTKWFKKYSNCITTKETYQRDVGHHSDQHHFLSGQSKTFKNKNEQEPSKTFQNILQPSLSSTMFIHVPPILTNIKARDGFWGSRTTIFPNMLWPFNPLGNARSSLAFHHGPISFSSLFELLFQSPWLPATVQITL